MNKKSTTVAQLAARLSNTKMVQVVARLFSKEEFSISEDGKIELTDEEEAEIAKTYGQGFLDKLKAENFSDTEAASSSTDLFNEAVRFKAGELVAEKDQLIEKLQKEVGILAAAPEAKPAAQAVATPGAAGAALPMVLNMKAGHNALAARLLAGGSGADFALLNDASIDVSDLNQEFSMVMPPKVKLELLTKKLYVAFDDAKYMTRIQSNTDWIGSAAEMSEVSQQFTPKWTPKGTAKFTPLRIPYRRHKINVLINPTDVIKSWLLFLYEQGKTLAEMPVTRYIIENHILPRVSQDITMAMLGKGKFVEKAWNSVSDGDAGDAAKNSMDGFETILVEGKSDPTKKFNYFRGAVNLVGKTDAEIYAAVDAFARQLSGVFVNLPYIFCSDQILEAYVRGDYAANGKYTGVTMEGGSIRFSTVHLVPLKSMYNSPILFATPIQNFIELVDYSKAESCITKIEEANYDVKIFGEYSLSVGFKIQEAVFAYVPDGYTPVSAVNSDADPDEDVWQLGGAESDDDADTPDDPEVLGDNAVSMPATAGSANRTYATTDGSAVEAEVTTQGTDWLSATVDANGHKVTFTAQAFPYDAEGMSPRSATVRISTGEAYLDVTVSQAMAEQNAELGA